MSMKKFLEALETNAGKKNLLNEDALEVVKSGKGWYYVPKQTFLGGLMKVAVHEVSDNKWEILYCAPESKISAGAKKGAEDLMAHKEIEHFQKLLSEEVEGSPNSLKGWAVKGKPWQGSFENCLKKCVDLVEGKADATPVGFKKK